MNEKMRILLFLALLLLELSLGSQWGRGLRQLDNIKCEERVWKMFKKREIHHPAVPQPAPILHVL